MVPSTAPGEGEVRLVGGPDQTAGRVEVYHNDIWGTICTLGWDLGDATVVCRQLGFTMAGLTFPSLIFGTANGPIWYFHVLCGGYEANLTQCAPSVPSEGECSHNDDVGVFCKREFIIACH